MVSLHSGTESKAGEQGRQLVAKKYTKTTLVVGGMAALLSVVMIWFGYLVSQRIEGVQATLSEYNSETAIATNVLNRIHINFGYGGFIHNFKNYVLRQDPALVPRIETNLRETYRAIENYPRHGVFQDELDALAALTSVIQRYETNFALAQRLINEGKGQAEVDRLVRVDDTLALAAINHLSEHVLMHGIEYEQRLATQLDDAENFMAWSALTIPLVLVLAVVLLVLFRKIVLSHNKLRAMEHYLRDLFEASPDPTLIVDQQGVIRAANLQATTLFGYAHEELVGLSIAPLLPERIRGRHPALVSSAFHNQSSRMMFESGEMCALTKDGTEIPVEISLSFTRGDGRPLAITVVRDISQRKQSELASRRHEAMLSRAQRVANTGSWDWDISSNELSWSEEIHRIFGTKPESFDATYNHFLQLIHPADRDDVVNAVNSAVVYDQPYDIEHRIVRPDGEERIVREQGEVFRDAQRNAVHMTGVVTDITESKHIAAQLRLADNVFNHTSEGIIVTDIDNRILRVNQAFTNITGYSMEEALGRRPGHLLGSGKHGPEFYRELWQSLHDRGGWEGEITDKRKDGSLFPAWHNISTVKNDAGKVVQYISIFADITEEKAAEQRIQHLAQFDQLTNLPNRALFTDRLQHALIRARRADTKVGLMFIDLDGFKHVNDTLGHQAGDELLQKVARRLSQTVRGQDTVARLGGDEFTIVLEDLRHAKDGAIVAEKTIKAVGQRMQLHGEEITVGASVGISVFPDDADNDEDLIKYADLAMYQAKKQGKNRFRFYTEELARTFNARFQLEHRLRKAIEQEELEVYYQPLVNGAEGRLWGAEALVRWRDPERGLVSPSEFIPLAEETGLIEAIGRWVLRTACAQNKLWHNAGFTKLRIAVNVSGQQISNGTIVDTVRETLESTGLPALFLELEITEGFVMEHPQQGIETLKALSELGVTLAIDDFGTGYSSLSYLKRLTIDRLKIDRSFVMDIPRDKDDEAIVATIIAMANNLGLDVIAEGVETYGQIEFLARHNCTQMQGYYFGKPMPAHEFEQLLHKSQSSKLLANMR